MSTAPSKPVGFTKATKRTAKLRLALCGPSGSGKTLSALRLAAGMGGRVALIDTERGSASLYADQFAFDVMDLDPPHKPSRYVAAIEAAAEYDVLIVDSLSHAWAGEGGLLETVDEVQAKGGNKFVAWGPASKAQNQLVNTILAFPGSVIVTMRTKQEYAMETDARGKQKPVKLGLAPVQRDGVEYEFGTVLDVGMDHAAGVGLAGKDRTGVFADAPPRVLTEDDGRRIVAWLRADVPAVAAAEPSAAPALSKQPADRAGVADALCKVIDKATTLDELRSAWGLVPKWFTVPRDEHVVRLQQAKDAKKAAILKAEQDRKPQLKPGDENSDPEPELVGDAAE